MISTISRWSSAGREGSGRDLPVVAVKAGMSSRGDFALEVSHAPSETNLHRETESRWRRVVGWVRMLIMVEIGPIRGNEGELIVSSLRMKVVS